MGFAAVAAHLVIFLALLATGTLLAGTLSDTLGDQVEAESEAVHRLRAATTEDIDLTSDGYASTEDRTYANFTNDGSEEIHLDDVTLLVDGIVTDDSAVATFEVRGSPSSDLWMPGEVLEVMTEDRGNVDISVVGPHASAAHRRA